MFHHFDPQGVPLMAGLLGIHISLPKLPIGKAVGDFVSNNVPGGGTIVGAVNTGIDVVKNAKLQPGVILKSAVQTGASAAVKQVQADVNASVQKSETDQALAGVGGKGGLLTILGIIGAFLLLRRRN